MSLGAEAKQKNISGQRSLKGQPLQEQIHNMLSAPEVESWRTLMGCFQACYQHFETNIGLKNFSYSKLQILLTIYLNPESNAAKMSEILYVSRANMSTFLKRLLEAGLIEEEYLFQSKRPVFKMTARGLKEFETVILPHLHEVIKIAPVFNRKTLVAMKEKIQTLKRSQA